MSRLKHLETRRRELLARCEEQRLELAYRITQISPAAELSSWTKRASARSAQNHPLAWLGGVAALLLMFRPKRMLGGVGWITALVALISKASTILRIATQLRATYASLKQQPRQ